MKNEISIRRAREGDEEALALVGQATFLETFAGVLDGAAIVGHCQKAHSASQYCNWLADSEVAIWLAEIAPGNAPVGYLVIAPPDLPMVDIGQDLELKRIYLLSRYHGGGTGKQLLAQAIDHAQSQRAARLVLGVYSGNTAAIAFYRRQGFANLAERKFNVGGKDYDDHVMSLALATA
ncbi:GNAT family N-acetyltransferase [Massilia eurypsychrophila]|jgi:ribosomal protein S18 acetylase RimI-like enzyme|uniref:GNAT family N-acetyltransferase n=1 Tax=Massilia eurypsychrophila TaxID=1485217 RepID=A0A2G8TCN7_9BURK|nr:GNAT family N-acetyltransferase [Massilia eurypsychrophila]PIL43729.1 GNAT family N-acetyltransferase [Massilia eurypsychrophila]